MNHLLGEFYSVPELNGIKATLNKNIFIKDLYHTTLFPTSFKEVPLSLITENFLNNSLINNENITLKSKITETNTLYKKVEFPHIDKEQFILSCKNDKNSDMILFNINKINHILENIGFSKDKICENDITQKDREILGLFKTKRRRIRNGKKVEQERENIYDKGRKKK